MMAPAISLQKDDKHDNLSDQDGNLQHNHRNLASGAIEFEPSVFIVRPFEQQLIRHIYMPVVPYGLLCAINFDRVPTGQGFVGNTFARDDIAIRNTKYNQEERQTTSDQGEKNLKVSMVIANACQQVGSS